MIASRAPGPQSFGLFFSLTPHHLFLFLVGTLANKLNVPQVLLPFSREPGRVPFLLEAQRGCYTWHSTHHDAVTIEPLYKNGTSCSQRAVLVAESTQPIRLSSIILAREVVTDHELRCDVKVDVIDSIEIVSRTRELYVDDAPLELMVRALDAKGNTFSTLAGMVFEWSIAQDNESGREELSSKIRILKFSEAEYSPPDYIAEMEKGEQQGDVILVSGMRTGAAVVKVRIYEPFYKKVSAALIRLLVLENIFLIPSHDIYLLVGAYIKYQVAKMVQGRMTGFTIHPGSRWSLEVGQVYIITVDVFDKSSTRVHISDVEGGSGNFTWTSSNETVAMVTTKGVVAAGQVRGNSTVMARDVQNPFRYGEIKALNPVEVALVTWQSVKEMVFEGGPHPWILEPSRFFLEMSVEKPKGICITEARLPAKRKQNQYVYRVLCLDLGEQIGNHPGVLNPSPSVETVQVHFICAHPASMLVTPVYRVRAGTQPCPLPQYNKQLIPVSSLRDSVLELAVFDQHGRKFDNFSSLMLEWKSSNETLAHFEESKSMEMVAKDDGSGQTQLHGHQILKVHQMKGTVLIAVNFVGYSGNKSPVEISNSPRSAVVELLLVEDVTVQPENATIYNHPDVKEIFHLVEGSGYFLVNSSEQDMVTITYMEAESSVQVVPLHPGFLTLEVYDLCLAFLGPAMARLRVSDIQEVELDLIDKVEIGKTVLVAVRVLGSSKHPFRNKYFRNMDVRLQLASAIVTLRLMEDQDEYSENYMLRAVTIGQTTLVAIATDRMGRKFTSTPRHIEIMSEGGPQPQSIIHFSISNQTVAAVNRRGQVTGKAVGTAVVHGTIQTVNEDTGKVIVFSQDEVQIEVVQLRAVRILAAATRLITATEMPVYVMGVTSTQTPFSFSNANPSLTFHWSMSKRDVLDLVPRHSEVFLQLPAENNFAMVVHTKVAGRTTIKVTVRSENSSFGHFEGSVMELSDEIQILVFEKLQLFYEGCQPEQILMPMNSQLKLHTNREGAAFVSSRVLKCFPNSSVIEEDSQGLLRSGSIAGTAVLEVTSIEPFGVNQTTITGVQVAPVTYLRMSSYPKLYTAQGRTLSAFPLGMSLTFIVEFYNNIGEKFHTHNTRLYMALNRDDLLLIGPGNRNYTYMAQAVNRGVTVVGLWDQRHPGMADYIPVAVEHAIEPDTKLTFVGDVICFSTHLVNQHGEPGMWMISTNNVIQTDTVTGVGVARSPGTATIFHDIPGVVKTFREVVVNASSRLTLSYDLKTYLTNIPNATVFKLFISTGRNDVNLKGSCTSSQASAVKTVLLPETLLLCHVQFSNTLLDVPASKVFLIRSEFSMERGVYVCLIKVRQKSEELRQILSVADTSVYGWATLVSGRSKNGMQRILIPFIPGFYMNQSELVLSHKDIGDLRVLGVERVLESLEVFSSSPFLAVSGHKHSILTTGMAIYLVRVVNFTAFQMSSPVFINVSCVLTSQHEAVLVRAKDASGSDHCEESGVLKNLVGSYQILLFTLFAVLASTAFIFLAYNAFLNKIQTVPVVYVPTIGTTQPGSYTTCSPPHFLNPQPPLVQSRLQHWLWSIKH
ncbi:Nuclear pore membrane glycoprotein 210-like [Cricetulus griseus]|uniref:Nuclear pore membrane glycoprotein 210-like n=1 Tax=Cricetulus griseus TaxID=10029 RepID=G3HC02_CRIGR|nr:Nuclear pore membrane glycoprotein 210-like [Cricetulus griseus]